MDQNTVATVDGEILTIQKARKQAAISKKTCCIYRTTRSLFEATVSWHPRSVLVWLPLPTSMLAMQRMAVLAGPHVNEGRCADQM